MKQKSILMLGGSAQQVVAIKKAKELGYRTVVCDYLPDNPGQFEADAFYLESTTDKEKMLEIAECEHVGGVLAYSSDPASPTAAYVATKLGLPTNPEHAIEVMSYKHLFREHLRKYELPCPQAVSFNTDASVDEVASKIASFAWPIVIKPTDSSGSKGVTVLETPNHLLEAMHFASSFSRNEVLIAEEYVHAMFPHVIGGDIFVVDGEVRFWGLMSCLRDVANGLVPCGERTPTGLTRAQYANVQSVLSRLVASLGIEFGELNVEVIIGADDTPYVLELASRAGGNMIPLELSDVSGVDLVAANILCAMGEAPSEFRFDTFEAAPYMTYVLHANRDGVFTRVAYSDTAIDALYRECLYVKPGDTVEAFNGANKAVGVLFLEFGCFEDLYSFEAEVDHHIRVVLEGDAA